MSIIAAHPGATMLYHSARQPGSLEYVTIEFWSYILQQYFQPPNFYIAPQQPANPSVDRLRRVDLVIKYIEEQMQPRVLCFVECKRHNAPQDDIDTVESQAIEACQTYCQGNNISIIYAMTAVGTTARFWKYFHMGKVIEPLFGANRLGQRSEYVDANDLAKAGLITQAFNNMKTFPPTMVRGSEYQQLGQMSTTTASQASSSNITVNAYSSSGPSSGRTTNNPQQGAPSTASVSSGPSAGKPRKVETREASYPNDDRPLLVFQDLNGEQIVTFKKDWEEIKTNLGPGLIHRAQNVWKPR
ncbi:MAG: hypothetical protein M1819_000805 [Sarea resinae]|nr:MAG: hypothetical protein M1819_000805 [Sarea resinae]